MEVYRLGCHLDRPLACIYIIPQGTSGGGKETEAKVGTRFARVRRDYSTPVDMWAFGTVMAELLNFRPIFPGSGHIDQIDGIIKVLGDPADYGVDELAEVVRGPTVWSRPGTSPSYFPRLVTRPSS